MAKDVKQRNGALAERPPTHGEDPLLTLQEAAQQLGVSDVTIHNWVMPDNQGRRRLKSVVLPSRRRKVRQSVIDAVLAGTAEASESTEEVEYD